MAQINKNQIKVYQNKILIVKIISDNFSEEITKSLADKYKKALEILEELAHKRIPLRINCNLNVTGSECSFQFMDTPNKLKWSNLFTPSKKYRYYSLQ